MFVYGAILGDMIGAPYEFDRGNKSKDFPLFVRASQFTDDTVMTVAVAEALMESYSKSSEDIRQALVHSMQAWGRKYPDAGYGGNFRCWLIQSNPKPYRSFPYLLDQKTGFLHSSSCSRVQNLKNAIGYTLKSAIQQRYKPCSCCQDEYWSLSAQLTEEVIQRSEYNYIYTWDSKFFHWPSCIHVKQIPYVDLRGSVYYSKCIRIGKKPCGWCKPSPNDQVLPDHVIIPPEAQGIKDPLKNARTCLVIRKMNKAEATAYKRYKIARKERDLAKTNKGLTPEERHDLMTLTNPGFAFWAVPGYQSFHTRSCPNLSRLSGFRGFSSFAAAEMAGFSPCRFCKPSAKEDIKQSVPIYSEERKGERLELLDALCEAKGYAHSFEAPFYLISTPVGEWKLNVQMRPIDVYHINKVLDQDNSGDYHKQHRLFISLQDTFRYINRHDRMLMSKQKKENK